MAHTKVGEGIDYGIRNCWCRTDRCGLTDPLHPEWIERCRGLRTIEGEWWEEVGTWQRVVHQRS